MKRNKKMKDCKDLFIESIAKTISKKYLHEGTYLKESNGYIVDLTNFKPMTKESRDLYMRLSRCHALEEASRFTMMALENGWTNAIIQNDNDLDDFLTPSEDNSDFISVLIGIYDDEDDGFWFENEFDNLLKMIRKFY